MKKAKCEEDLILKHLETVQAEKEIIKKAMESVGGRPQFGGTLSNVIFGILVAISIVLSFVLKGKYSIISLEFGILLISLKIMYLMTYQDKVSHFLFWVLTGIEIRITAMRKEVKEIKERMEELGRRFIDGEVG